MSKFLSFLLVVTACGLAFATPPSNSGPSNNNGPTIVKSGTPSRNVNRNTNRNVNRNTARSTSRSTANAQATVGDITVENWGGGCVYVPPINGLGASDPPYNELFDGPRRSLGLRGPVYLDTNKPIVTAESHYANPYFVANPHYLPPSTPDPQWIINPFCKPGAKLAEPPRPLSDIIIHDTGAK